MMPTVDPASCRPMPMIRRLAGLACRIDPGHAARHVDHQPDGKLAHRRHPAAARLGHQHAVRAGGLDVDVADVDRHPRDRHQLGQRREQLGWAGRRPVGDDDLAGSGRLDQRGRIERLGPLMQHHLAQRAQPGERARAVVQAARLGGVRQQDARSGGHCDGLPWLAGRAPLAVATHPVNLGSPGRLPHRTNPMHRAIDAGRRLAALSLPRQRKGYADDGSHARGPGGAGDRGRPRAWARVRRAAGGARLPHRRAWHARAWPLGVRRHANADRCRPRHRRDAPRAHHAPPGRPHAHGRHRAGR